MLVCSPIGARLPFVLPARTGDTYLEVQIGIRRIMLHPGSMPKTRLAAWQKATRGLRLVVTEIKGTLFKIGGSQTAYSGVLSGAS